VTAREKGKGREETEEDRRKVEGGQQEGKGRGQRRKKNPKIRTNIRTKSKRTANGRDREEDKKRDRIDKLLIWRSQIFSLYIVQ
jgi:hypothetical protein